MPDITPFTVDIPEAELADLKQRLAMTRWPDRETPDDWSQGTPLAYMQELVAYWQSEYDWRKCESWINSHEGFKTDVDGLDIHFLHIRSAEMSAKPLLITHGWPGSILEFRKVIGPLTDPAAHGGNKEDAFHVVLPTLPGYGFSEKPAAPGWGIEKIATAFNQLMVRLGYDSYFAQGGDWGSAVTAEIGGQNLGNCKGIHINMETPRPTEAQLAEATDEEKASLAKTQFYFSQDAGYSTQQSTRPQTLGYGLVDSPAGQAAWIIEKFYQWMDCQGHPENVVSRDELLDAVMMYWLPAAGASSARLYWESFGRGGATKQVEIPAGYSRFPRDIFTTSERWAKNRLTNLVFFRAHEEGGHFAAFEKPERYIEDVRDCFRPLRG